MYSKNLRELREKLDLSVAKLAKQLDMSASTLTSYERGERTPSVEFLTRLYKVLNVNTNWFVSGQGNMFNSPQFEQVQDELALKVRSILREEGLIK
jgi:transcriptional regulator with XRE-family HTH domain|nr:MAG TPA: helix-turn-helix domain protein [Caudoviricetes sp.]